MSLHKCPYTKILEINPHPNAERLEILKIYGFDVVAKKGQYISGDKVLFIPPDSILPEWLDSALFPEGSKIRLLKRRVRQIRIRGFPSAGMAIDPRDSIITDRAIFNDDSLEFDYGPTLGITKYEPPFADHGPRTTIKRNKPLENPRFHQYKGCENIKWFPNLFKEGDRVIVQEKLHGSNCRASIQPAVANTLWKKVKKLFGRLPEFERCYGSNMVQLQERAGHTGYYGSDVYGAVLEKVKAFDKMKPGETIFGELIGPGIQKGYDYGHKEHHFVLFDVKVTKEDGTQEFLDPMATKVYAFERGFDFVPVLYAGPFVKEEIMKLAEGPSVYWPQEKVREGVVIKAQADYGQNGGKKALKVINPTYLDNPENTDLH